MTRHPVISKGISVTLIPSAGGAQEAVALHLERFHGWLVLLNPDRVKDATKRAAILKMQTWLSENFWKFNTFGLVNPAGTEG